MHQAFQLARAAEENGLLGTFFCSFFDAPGMWGHRLQYVLGSEPFRNRRIEGIPSSRIVEHPWPELAFKLKQRLLRAPGNAWIHAAHQFDAWAAQQLASHPSDAVICSENCAFKTFKVATAQGTIKIYDCPGYNSELTQEAAEETGRRFNLPFVSVADSQKVRGRKRAELHAADRILAYSDLHRSGIVKYGVPEDKISVIPLWIDTGFWKPKAVEGPRGARLKVIYAGGINLRKGIPFLLEAGTKLESHIQMTLVGSLDPDVTPCLRGKDFVSILPAVTKACLLELYEAHDLLVLPSLGDSFGFVALEAMACGLPVIVTDQCGVPVPDAQWRVPVMDSDAIAAGLQRYLDNRDLLHFDGMRAVAFAKQFTPERYRHRLGSLMRALLEA